MTGINVRLRVGAETYALPVDCVLEVGQLGAVDRLPGSGTAVLGLFNLRGRVLPTFDLAAAFGIPRDDLPSHLVVTESNGRLAGLAVDDVLDVAPFEGPVQQAEADYLVGSTLQEGELIGLIDVDRMFAVLEQAAAP
jgi:purine-binding chemotaxis protein CheW